LRLEFPMKRSFNLDVERGFLVSVKYGIEISLVYRGAMVMQLQFFG